METLTYLHIKKRKVEGDMIGFWGWPQNPYYCHSHSDLQTDYGKIYHLIFDI